jgi:hypothetical protein
MPRIRRLAPQSSSAYLRLCAKLLQESPICNMPFAEHKASITMTGYQSVQAPQYGLAPSRVAIQAGPIVQAIAVRSSKR